MKYSDKFKIGVLLLLILSSGVIYINYAQKNLKMRIDNDKTTFYTVENGRWVVSGREYNKLFEGTHLLYRDVKSINVSHIINEDNNSFIVSRLTNYKKGPQIIDTYTYSGNITSEAQFPISHNIEIKNAKGLIYQYEVRDLVYSGNTIKNVESPMSFGRKMYVEWEPSNYWSTVYKTGILKLRFRPESNDVNYSIRLFDPTIITVLLNNNPSNLTAELGAKINISARVSPSTSIVCIDIDHPNYGKNVSCGLENASVIFNPSYFRTSIFSDNKTSEIVTFINGGTHTLNVSANSNDEVTSLQFDMTGNFTNGTYPENVVIQVLNGSNTISLGDLIPTISEFNDSTTSKNFSVVQGHSTLGYLHLLKNKDVLLATVNLTGANDGKALFEQVIPKEMTTDINSVYKGFDSLCTFYYYNSTADVRFVYTIPTGASQADSSWQLNHGAIDTYNTTIPSSCWDALGNGELNLGMHLRAIPGFGESHNIGTYSSQPQCYNGTSWMNIGTYKWNAASSELIGNPYNDINYSKNFNDNNYLTGAMLPSGEMDVNVSEVLFVGADESAGWRESTFYEETMFWDTASAIYSPYLYLGDNTTNRVWNLSGQYLISTAKTNNFASSLNAYLSSCIADENGFCDVPLNFYTTSSGNLTIDAISISYGNEDVYTINLSVTDIYNYLNTVDGYTTIPITISADTNGTINISNLKYDYIGGNKTYTITSHTSDYGTSTSKNVNFYYSDYFYNLSPNIDNINFYPPYSTVQGLEPFGQTSSQPIINITMQNYANNSANFSIYQSNTDSCVALYYSLNSTKPTLESSTTLLNFNATTTSTSVGPSTDPIYNITNQSYSGNVNLINPKDCVADYTLDDNTNSYYVRDYCYDNNDAMVFPPGGYTNSGYSTEGVVNSAFSFSDTNHYVLLPDSTQITHAFSIIMWFKIDHPDPWSYLETQGLLGGRVEEFGAGRDGISINLVTAQSSQPPYIVTNIYGSLDCWTFTAQKDWGDSWHQLVLTWDGTTDYDGTQGSSKLYIDNELKGSSNALNFDTLDYTDVPSWYLGKTDSGKFNGSIDDVRFYNRAITDDERNILYNAARGTFYKSIITVNTTQTYGIHNSKAIKFDGTSSYAQVDPFINFSQSQSLTEMVWIKPADVNDGRKEILNIGNYSLYQDGSDIVFKGSSSIVASNAVYANIWAHIAVTKDANGNARIYVNRQLVKSGNIGTLDTDKVLSIGIPDLFNNTRVLLYNNFNDIKQYMFKGDMDEIRIFNSVLTESQIRDEMDSSISKAYPSLLYSWNLNDNTSTHQHTNIYNVMSGNEHLIYLYDNSPVQKINFTPVLNITPTDNETLVIDGWYEQPTDLEFGAQYYLLPSVSSGSSTGLFLIAGILMLEDTELNNCQFSTRSHNDGKLHHFILSVDSDNMCHLNYDGVNIDATTQYLTNRNFTFSSIGYTDGYNGFRGSIGDIKIYTVAENDYKLTNSWNTIKANLTNGDNFGIWLWADYNCEASNYYYAWRPTLYFRSCCSNCVCDETLT